MFVNADSDGDIPGRRQGSTRAKRTGQREIWMRHRCREPREGLTIATQESIVRRSLDWSLVRGRDEMKVGRTERVRRMEERKSQLLSAKRE